jgi:hypothetical protein
MLIITLKTNINLLNLSKKFMLFLPISIMKKKFSHKKRNILIEAAPSYDPDNNGATRYEIDEVMGLKPEVLNMYLVRLYHAKLVRGEGDKLVTTQRGLRRLQKYYELRNNTNTES